MSVKIDYNHQNNIHTQSGAKAAFTAVLSECKVNSLLDVGCGTGTWLKAALDLGVAEIFGVDGVHISTDRLLVSADYFQQQDLTLAWDLNRRFDLVICLEVAEHLDSCFAKLLIETLTIHADRVIFGAACPGQPGQHHVNCQWPVYWQELFNSCGFACSDTLRWKIWNDSQIEPWYRQNIFIADKTSKAGSEARILPVVHPGMVPYFEDWLKPG